LQAEKERQLEDANKRLSAFDVIVSDAEAKVKSLQ
jgi:hypothetical protein